MNGSITKIILKILGALGLGRNKGNLRALLLCVFVVVVVAVSFVTGDKRDREHILGLIRTVARNREFQPRRYANEKKPPHASSPSLPEVEEGYVEIGYNEKFRYYLSPSSVEKREEDGNEYIVGWIQVIRANPDQEEPINGKKPGFALELWAVNPKVKQTQLLNRMLFTKNRKMITRESHSFSTERWHNFSPKFAEEMYWENIMNVHESADQSRSR